MQEPDLVPDIIGDSAAIRACENGKQWQQALGLLATMQEADLSCGIPWDSCGIP